MTTADRRLWTGAYRHVRRWVLDRDGGVCQIRGAKCTHWATEVDHIRARADGGDCYDPANLRAACRACNGGRAADRTNRLRRAQVPYEDMRL